MSKLKSLVHTRTYIRGRVTRLSNEISDSVELYDQSTLLQHVATLKEDSASLKELDGKILDKLWDDGKSDSDNSNAQDKELDAISNYKEKLNISITLLEQKLAELNSSPTPINVNRLKPETAPLPTYGGEREESLEKFLFQFESITAVQNYSGFERFLLLQKCMKGKASILISSLEVDKQSYRDAKLLLEQAFAAPLVQKYNTLDRLVDLQSLSLKDPLYLVSEMRQVKESFRRLRINIDLVLQYFYWKALPDDLKSQLVSITNNSKPDLVEIESNIFQAIDRVQSFPAKLSPEKFKRKTSTLATKVDYGAENARCVKCSLCSSDHPYFKCTVYKTPEEKVKRLKDAGGCTLCGYINHKPNDCKMRNLKCKLCKGNHFPVLCIKSNKSRQDVHRTNSNAMSTSFVESSVNNSKDLALPTFTVRIRDTVVRVMRDTGAQTSLITDTVANDCKLRIVENNIKVTINGFNGAREYLTKLVEVPFMIGDSIVLIKALCVPCININLDVMGMGEVVRILNFKGFKLADELLCENTNKIDNIDLILGSDYSYCNPISTKVFGLNNESTILITPMGVMIEGSISKLSRDVKFLEDNEVLTNNFSISVDKENYSYNSNDVLSISDLEKAASQILDSQCLDYLNVDESLDELNVELNRELSSTVIRNASRSEDGRLVLPLMWNSNVQHLLGHNFNLAKNVLKSNLNKLQRDPDKLKLTDDVFRDQENMGVIERVHNLTEFKENFPCYSFLPHMSVFRMNKETTKCRVVYLSNITENNPEWPTTVSHNQAINSGPNLNQKLAVSLMLLRFDRFLLIFDLVKAFLMIAMNVCDQARLLLMWYKNVTKGDFSLVYYKAKRLPFGISCAPALLMIALYKILIIDDDERNRKITELRRLTYSLFYMDNGGFTTNNVQDIKWAQKVFTDIFREYRFNLQQFVCNSVDAQKDIDFEFEEETPDIVNLYGLKWNRIHDTLSTDDIYLDRKANTKRLVLQTYARNFDIYGYNLPLFNRCKLFIHKLQCENDLSWDTKLPDKYQKEWTLICNQLNHCITVKVPRFVGKREDSYELLAFTDASKDLYGTVLYIRNLGSNYVSFFQAKNKVVGTKMSSKTIPSLELCAVLFGVECLTNSFRELTSSQLLTPVTIEKLTLYTDSMIVLNWLDGVTNKLSKSQNKLSVYVRNRLFKIENLCSNNKSVTFNFVVGGENPADHLTRAISPKQIAKTVFYTGPKLLDDENIAPNVMSVTVPCPSFVINSAVCSNVNDEKIDAVLSSTKYSSFSKLVNVLATVYLFIGKLKDKLKSKGTCDSNVHTRARIALIKNDQRKHYSDCFEYFANLSRPRSMPNIIKQLNVFVDSNGLLRVGSKFRNLKNERDKQPLLLSKNSSLASLIISSLHDTMGHAGKYSVLIEIRKEFYIPSIFSKVKSVLKECILCKRFNAKPIAINQSPYRLDRINPPTIPFRFIFVDHFGPYNVKIGGKRTKVYILLISCMYTRAFNAEICKDMTVDSYLRAFQIHVHKYGIAAKITSDPGSTLTAGGNIISSFLSDASVSFYLSQHNIDNVEFTQFCKGNSSLGGLVESGVKLYKKLIYGYIRNNCLDYFDFEFTISEVTHIVNKRPVAFVEALRDSGIDEVPQVISPEMLIHGYSLPSVNCVPGLHPIPDDPIWEESPINNIKDTYKQLRSVRSKMLELYNDEFLSKLIVQAVDKGDRYSAKTHSKIDVGDVVCMKEKFTKPNSYPLAIVKSVTTNSLGEVTNARIKRGDSGEVVDRHSSVLIPVLKLNREKVCGLNPESNCEENVPEKIERPKRIAATKASAAIAQQLMI